MDVVKKRESFVETVLEYYRLHGRHDLPWRQPEHDGSFDPYKIMVSEIMLQQTQVPRVIPKYHVFLQRFPTVYALAAAPLGDVLLAWQGLGYNRRAKYLWRAAQIIERDFLGEIPNGQSLLERLPGIGTNTAGAIRAYAFNEPAVFIETNIRTTFIHHFFDDQDSVPDAAIRDLVIETLDMYSPRVWYWGLMDYGTYLKQMVGNVSRASKTYAKQSKFVGSRRQIRGKVLKLLALQAYDEIALLEALDDPRAHDVLIELVREGLVQKRGGSYALP